MKVLNKFVKFFTLILLIFSLTSCKERTSEAPIQCYSIIAFYHDAGYKIEHIHLEGVECKMIKATSKDGGTITFIFFPNNQSAQEQRRNDEELSKNKEDSDLQHKSYNNIYYFFSKTSEDIEEPFEDAVHYSKIKYLGLANTIFDPYRSKK